MISGIHAHICDKCIIQAQQILNEEVKTKANAGDAPEFKLIKPIDMKRHLDAYVIGQDEAKKYASILGYNYNSSEWFKQSYKVLNKNYNFKKAINTNNDSKRKNSFFKKIIKMNK